MARIRGKNTSPELALRRLIYGMGLRYRLHRRELPGTPDIVLRRLRKVIFMHGCFWHRHQGCAKAYTPKSRTEFWEAKFDATVARDRRVQLALEESGWHILVVWECELSNPDVVMGRLRQFLGVTPPV